MEELNKNIEEIEIASKSLKEKEAYINDVADFVSFINSLKKEVK